MLAPAKGDSASAKMHSIDAKASMLMAKQDSAKCCKSQMLYAAASPMFCNSCQMFHHHIVFHLGLAICFLLLAITLLMISNQCRCKKCCECKDGKCECKEEKKG
jgi:hypothetical protein